MLLSAKDSLLLIVDAQEKLLPAIHQRDVVTSRMRWLGEIAMQLDLPILITEQYPKGLGYTVDSLQDIIEAARVVEKTHFSALRDDTFRDVLSEYKKKHVGYYDHGNPRLRFTNRNRASGFGLSGLLTR